MKKEPKTTWQKIWHFLWYEDSVASWFVSIILAFLLIKFLVYPALGLVFGTQFPVVAVVSNSMDHDRSFDDWWANREDLYLQFNITKQQFSDFPMRGGFNKGDIIILFGIQPERIAQGDIIVYWGGKDYPIIHRVVAINTIGASVQTMGDNNPGQIPFSPNERDVRAETILGRAALRVPYLGWVKIFAVDAYYGIRCSLFSGGSPACVAYCQNKGTFC